MKSVDIITLRLKYFVKRCRIGEEYLKLPIISPGLLGLYNIVRFLGWDYKRREICTGGIKGGIKKKTEMSYNSVDRHTFFVYLCLN